MTASSRTPGSRTVSDPLIDRLLRAVRTRVVLRAALRWGAVGVAVAALTAAALLWLEVLVDVPGGLRTSGAWLPGIVLLATLLPVLRARQRATSDRLTRLIDERAGLGNMLSTYRAPNTDGPVARAFERRAAQALQSVDPKHIVGMDAATRWRWAAGCILVTVLSLVGTTGGAGGRRPGSDAAARMASFDEDDRADEAGLPTLGVLELRARPPAYAQLPTETFADGASLSALPGTIVDIVGSGSAGPDDLAVHVAGGEALAPVSAARGWRVPWTVRPEHRGLSIEAVAAEQVVERRVVPLRLLRDREPSVALTEPASDMVLATPTGTLPIRARALDDYGVAELTLHWVHSRGSGESFDFMEGQWAWDAQLPVDGGREASLDLALAELDLEPGDVLHVRAVALDANDVTGPGIGVSATRQIRISEADDFGDVTTLIGFPIEREREPLLRQRLIILLTEALRYPAASHTDERLLAEARSIADEQARLRARIGEQIFSRATGAMQDPEAHLDFEEGEAEVFLDELETTVEQGPVIDPETGIASIANVEIPAHEHDSDPIVAINRSLLTVYNYMWEAERELRSAMLDPSLVPQHRALELLQEMRNAERVFARGRVVVPPIDVAGVRGSGEIDDADPVSRTSGNTAPPTAERVVEAIDGLLDADPIGTGRVASVTISGLALDLLESLTDPTAGEILVRASAAASAGDASAVREGLTQARTLLRGSSARASTAVLDAPTSLAAARYTRGTTTNRVAGGVGGRPFVFATLRYASGDWDSAPLVPTNLIHSLAQYTDLPVEPDGVTVDLSSAEIFDYPLLYLTGHLPVFFDEAESQNLVAFVDRGGFVFIDDHNHDIDGAFHRSVTAELTRLFGPNRLTPIPADHELYSSFFVFEDGPPITGHELSGWGDGLIHRELYQIEVAGRIGVLYSNKDYSSEWSYHADNKRFLAVDNTRFGVNILVYALTR